MFEEPRMEIVEKPHSLALFWTACKAVHRNPRLMLLVLSNAVSYGVGEAKFKLQATFIASVWPLWAVGLYRGLHHSCGFLGFILARRLVGRVKPFYIFVFRDIYLNTMQAAALIMNNTLSPLLMAGANIAFGPGRIASETLQQQEFTDEQRATMGSLSSSASSIVFAATAIGIGAISDRYGVRIGVGISVFLSAICLPINIKLFRREA